MYPPLCDPDCQARRFRLYLVYLGLLLTCMILALCHFLVNLIRRRKIREARDYHSRRASITYILTRPFPPEEFQSVKDAFRITTDGVTGMTIELPEESHTMNGFLHHNGPYGSSDQRPSLQQIPEEDSRQPSASNSTKHEIVEVDVHHGDRGATPRLPFRSYDRMAILGAPVAVAVATLSTVSAVVAKKEEELEAPTATLESISRPLSAHSAFDILNEIATPPMLRTPKKSYTC